MTSVNISPMSKLPKLPNPCSLKIHNPSTEKTFYECLKIDHNRPKNFNKESAKLTKNVIA